MQFLNYGNGRRFFLKDFRNAEQFKPYVAPPRQKFQGYVNFIVNRRLVSSELDNLTFRTRISSLVRTATLPEVNFVTEQKNSFNRKKIIQTGVELSPVSMTVMDTVQNEWLTLFMKYYSFHYMNPRNKFDSTARDTSYEGGDTQGGYQKSSFGTQNVSGNTSTKGYQWNSNDFGVNLGITKNFFERIDIILYHGNKGVQYSLFNPMMKGFSASELDYASSDVMDFKIDFEYENFTTTNVYNFELSEQDKARFENMEGVTLPGMSNLRTPIALEKEQPITVLSGAENKGRKRTPQFVTSYKEGEDRYTITDEREDKYKIENQGVDSKLYTLSQPAEEGGETGLLGGIADFLEDNPFGRMIDRGLTAKLNGQNVGDVLKGALTSELNFAINNPDDGPADIFDTFAGSDKQANAGEENEEDGT